MLDNSSLIAPFIPVEDDGDTFLYTEMIDRGQKKGNNNRRILKTFYHRSQEEFWAQWPGMKQLADIAQVRLMTRLAPRSYKKVGKHFTQLVVEAAMAENWTHMKKLYSSACGLSSPVTKVWLFDVDNPDKVSERVGCRLENENQLIKTIPSKKGLHYITKPFDMRTWSLPENVSLHKDNPTNLYIPDGAN